MVELHKQYGLIVPRLNTFMMEDVYWTIKIQKEQQNAFKKSNYISLNKYSDLWKKKC